MKMDKEFVVKHKFWLLLAGGAFFTLIGIFYFFFIAPRATADARKKVETEWGTFTTVGDVKNDKFVEKAKKDAEVEEKKKTEVWEAAAAQQDGFFTWPKAVEDEFEFTSGNRAAEITVQAKEAKLAELPEDDFNPRSGTHRFHGFMMERDAEYIVVKGRPRKDAKDTRPLVKKFHRTPKVKVLTPEDKEKGIAFAELQPYVGSLVAVTYDRGMYSYDDLTDTEQERFIGAYKGQLMDVLKEAGPLNELGGTVVQFKDWTWKKGGKLPENARFFHWVTKWNTQNEAGGLHDISEEAWIAQEDLCIYRELFRLVKKANDYVANFEALKAPGKGKATLKEFEGENPYWKLALSLTDDNKLKVRITNKLNRLQTLDVRFAVKLTPDGAYKVIPPLNGLPRLPAGAAGGKDTFEQTLELQGYPPKGIFGVRQVLTWETAAVKRIDQISIGTAGSDKEASDWATSHRTSNQPLLAFHKKEVPADKKDDAAADSKMPAGMEGKMAMPSNLKGMRLGMEGGGVGIDRTLNGLVRDRYLDKTPQARRVPVGIALIVDQAHVSRVQTAFANSALRFLTNQILVNRYPHLLRPTDTPLPSSMDQGGMVAKGMPSGSPYGSPKFGLPTFSGRPTMPGQGNFPNPGGTYQPSSGAPAAGGGGGEEQESNVELVLYGVVSLYERFPSPRRSAPVASEQQPTPTPAPK